MTNANTYAQHWLTDHPLVDGRVVLNLGGFRIAVRSNSTAVLEKLGVYFAHTLDVGDADIEVVAIETPALELDLNWLDWAREPGKTGRKDAYVDVMDGRLVKKIRTGMVFLQSAGQRFAVGPCLQNDNQVINFINAQYMTWLQHNRALMCHASGLVVDGRCVAMAGFSGGGKSTLMLHMLGEDGVRYLTNDRLFLDREMETVRARGIAKLPRINPGTIVHNDALKAMLSPAREAELLALPQTELWHLEEKYDVDIEALYGPDKIQTQADLAAFLILNWRPGGDQGCQIEPIDLAARPELLERAIMKSPGPFYQLEDGGFFQDTTALDRAAYLHMLADVPIFEVTGRVDFAHAARFCLNQVRG